MYLRPALLSLLALGGCGIDPITKPPAHTGITETYTDDTGTTTWDDTGTTTTTDDTDTPPTDDTDTPPTDDTDESPPADDTGEPGDPYTGLDLYPVRMVVHPGATWTVRAVATARDGGRADAIGVVYGADDPAVATIDAAGLVTAIGEGTTNIHANFDTLHTLAQIEVRNDGVMTVRVVDSSGTPIVGAHVGRRDTDYVETDASGVALWPVDTSGPETVTAWNGAGWSSTTVVDTVSRTLTLSLLPDDWDGWDSDITGYAGFADVEDADFGEVVAGLAAAAIHGWPTAFELEQLFSEDREFTFYGIDVTAPANLFVEDVEDSYVAESEAGDVAVWAMAGPLSVTDLSAGFSGSGEAISLLIDNLGSMTWGYRGGGTVSAGGSVELNVQPDSPFSDATTATVPSLSVGFNGAETVLMVAMEETPEGWLVSGFGSGAAGDSVAVQHVGAAAVPGSTGRAIMAFAQVGGLGSGDGSCVTAGEVVGGSVVFPPLMEVGTVSFADRDVTYTVDSAADFVHVRLDDSRGHIQDVYSEGSWSGRVPDVLERFADSDVTIKVLAADTTRGNFEDQVSSGALSVESLLPDTTCRAVYH